MALYILKTISVDGEVVDPCNNCWPGGSAFIVNLYIQGDTLTFPKSGTLSLDIDNLTSGDNIYNASVSISTIAGGLLAIEQTVPEQTLTTPGRYRWTFTVDIDGETLTEYLNLTICPNIQWTKNSCKNYTITTDDATVTDFGVHSADGVLIETISLVDGSGSFTLPSEGVYLIRMSDGVTYSLYEFCDLQECLKKLIRAILCPDLDDPCCTNCREGDQEKREAIRKELNKLIAMYGMYLGGKMDDTTRYLGVFDFDYDPNKHVITIDPCQSAILQNMDNMIADIKEVTRRCGDGCDDTVTSSTPCTSC